MQTFTSGTSKPLASASQLTRPVIALSSFLLGFLVLALLAAIEYGAWALVVPPRPRVDESSKGDVENRAQPISVRASDGSMLAGLWYPAPTVEMTRRTAMLIHGFAESSSSVQAERVAALNQAGWNVAAVNLRGYGASVVS